MCVCPCRVFVGAREGRPTGRVVCMGRRCLPALGEGCRTGAWPLSRPLLMARAPSPPDTPRGVRIYPGDLLGRPGALGRVGRCMMPLPPSSGELRTVVLALCPAGAVGVEGRLGLSICFASRPGVPKLHSHSRPRVLEIIL